MMKHFVMIIGLGFLSPNAFALTGLDRWSEIRSSNDVLIMQPAFAKVFGPHGLFNACVTEDEFKSITPVKNCESCGSNESKQVVISRNYQSETCIKISQYNECLEYGFTSSFYPTSFYLPVIEGSNSATKDLIFSKRYFLPPCE